jgi:hypothetical protein
MSGTFTGACLCGRVEYDVQDPEALGYCHCTRCQRWTGSSLAGVVVAKENFKFTNGEELISTRSATTLRSSPRIPPPDFATHRFCMRRLTPSADQVR